MIFDFLKKQKDINKRKKIISVMILSLQIHDVQKELYLEALNILNKDGLERLYISLTEFTKEIEIKELDDINKNNFSEIAGMRKKEAVEKQKELNSFSFLINNL